jgi:hypothetical protein
VAVTEIRRRRYRVKAQTSSVSRRGTSRHVTKGHIDGAGLQGGVITKNNGGRGWMPVCYGEGEGGGLDGYLFTMPIRD